MVKKMLLPLSFVFLFFCSNAWAGYCREGDCLNGRGVYQWNDGSIFAGLFKNGEPDGEGIYTAPDKRKYNVVYIDGKPVESSLYSESEEAVKRRQKEAKTFNKAGLEYLRQKKYESAIFFFNKAITKWPDNPEFHENYHRAKGKR